jgi:hypothetical protein
MNNKIKTVVAGTVIVTSIGTGFTISNKMHDSRINNPILQEQSGPVGQSNTIAIANSLREQLNEYGKVEVFNGTIRFKHRYTYVNEVMLGLQQKEVITAYGQCYFSYYTELSHAKITVDGNTIIIHTPRVVLDTDTIHRVPDSFELVEDESRSGLLATKSFAKEAQVGWEDTFMTQSQSNIKDLYTDQQLYLMAKQAINNIVMQLNLNNVTIIVK